MTPFGLQSALSRQMQALEHEVGGALLNRSSTGVQATPGGRALAERTQQLLESYDANLRDVRRIIRGDDQELRIGYLGSAFEDHFASALEAFSRLKPETKVKLIDLFPSEQIIELRRGNLDMALTLELGNLLGRDFHTKKVAEVSSVVCLASEHPLASRQTIALAELKDETFLIASDSEHFGLRRRMTQLCQTFGKFRPKISGTSEDLSDAFTAVANEGFVVVMPAFLRDQKRPGMVIIPVCDEGATWDLIVAWHKGDSAKPLRTLLDTLS